MRELNITEIVSVKGGRATALWTILVFAHEGLNDLGRGIGSGIYDATH